jgi:hypothetical protein
MAHALSQAVVDAVLLEVKERSGVVIVWPGHLLVDLACIRLTGRDIPTLIPSV